MSSQPYVQPPASIEDVFVAATIGWIIYCPEEGSQLGDVFFSSEDAFRASQQHNKNTGHNSSIQPFYDLSPVSASAPVSDAPLTPRPTADTVFPWPFCVTYNGVPKENRTIYAPDSGSAAITMAQLVAVANQNASAAGYPPLWGWTGGNCP